MHRRKVGEYFTLLMIFCRYGSVDLPRFGNPISMPSSLSQLPYIMTRRHFSNTTSISSTGSDSFTSAAAADATVSTDDYVGRCIPIRLYEMLRVNFHFDLQGVGHVREIYALINTSGKFGSFCNIWEILPF